MSETDVGGMAIDVEPLYKNPTVKQNDVWHERITVISNGKPRSAQLFVYPRNEPMKRADERWTTQTFS